MTTAQVILLDHLVALLCVVTWLSAGVTVALRRARLGFGFLVAAVFVSLVRVATVALLAGRGWWFVQEKVILGLPMLVVAGSAAVLIAGRPVLMAIRTPAEFRASSVVALMTAGFAALAGLVVTFLVGYPLTWGTALVTVSIVGGAILLTARVIAEEAEPAAGPVVDEVHEAAASPPAADGAALSRRQLMRVAGGAIVVGAGSTGVGLSFFPTEAVSTGGGSGRLARAGVSVADLRDVRGPAPGGARKRHVLTAQSATVRFPSGREIDAWTYSGQAPGPAIAATEGDLIEVTLQNKDIEGGVTLHWHGYDIACGEDGAPGVTQHVVGPGEEFVYHFRADQIGTYWYHTHQASHIGVRKGLYGTLVVRPRGPQQEQLDLTLPVHTFDDAVVIGDQDGRIEYTVAAGTSVRLRLINTDSGPHRFTLAGTSFRVVAVDGRDLHQPDEVERAGLRLEAAGRYDVVFQMAGTPVTLVVDDDRDVGLLIQPDGADSAEPVVDDTGWPELDLLQYGQPKAVPFDADNADRHFDIVLDRGVANVDGRPTYAHTVNGRGHPSIPDQLVAEGDLVTFTVVNRSLETHPWHLHGHPVLILSRNGTAAAGSPLWVDTFDVRPGEVWKVAFEATNPGIWMNHCHNLPHAHQGMMLKLRYDGVSTPFGDDHDH